MPNATVVLPTRRAELALTSRALRVQHFQRKPSALPMQQRQAPRKYRLRAGLHDELRIRRHAPQSDFGARRGMCLAIEICGPFAQF
jgi:hypothetical protein